MGAMPVLKPFYIPWQSRLAQGLSAPTSSQSIDRVHQLKSVGASPADIHGVLTTLACRGGALSRELLPQEAAETDQKECGKDPHAPPGTGTGISSSLDHFVSVKSRQDQGNFQSPGHGVHTRVSEHLVSVLGLVTLRSTDTNHHIHIPNPAPIFFTHTHNIHTHI